MLGPLFQKIALRHFPEQILNIAPTPYWIDIHGQIPGDPGFSPVKLWVGVKKGVGVGGRRMWVGRPTN